MTSLDPVIIVLILLLIALGWSATVWVLHRRRATNRDGLRKGDARNPADIRRENPPDRVVR